MSWAVTTFSTPRMISIAMELSMPWNTTSMRRVGCAGVDSR